MFEKSLSRIPQYLSGDRLGFSGGIIELGSP
ncbi:hypothetical protein JOE11_000649 [Robbsia andropogonis]